MFTYKMPTEIFVGRGAARQIGGKVKELGGSRVILVTDAGVRKSGVLQGIEQSLKDTSIPYTIFDKVEQDPTIEGVAEATALLRDFKADLSLGVGGGSALDTAKAVAAMAKNPGAVRDYVGFGLLKEKPLPIIAVPTTAGTGSEATYWSVLADKVNDVKLSVGGWDIMPTLALVDAELTLTLPPRVTAATGMDALCHAIESYVSKLAHPISEACAERAIGMIAHSLRRAVNRGDDIEAREEMLLAATIAAMSFNTTRLGLAHALALPFGAHFHIPHGVINAILLPFVMEYNVPGAADKFVKVAKLFGENVEGLSERDAAYKAVGAVKNLLLDIGMPDGLKDWKVTDADLEMIAKEGITSKNVAANPRLASAEDLVAISRKAMEGLKS